MSAPVLNLDTGQVSDPADGWTARVRSPRLYEERLMWTRDVEVVKEATSHRITERCDVADETPV